MMGAECRVPPLYRSAGCIRNPILFYKHLASPSIRPRCFYRWQLHGIHSLQELEGECEGYLCIKQGWPGAIRTIFGDQERFETTYFAPFKV